MKTLILFLGLTLGMLQANTTSDSNDTDPIKPNHPTTEIY